jgi:hypothetical protein
MKMKDTHKYYYKLALKNKTSLCGDGSVYEDVVKEGTVDYIGSIVKKYNIKSISDCPCGLYENWIYSLEFDKKGIDYIGYDINDLIIIRNKTKFPVIEFIEFNMCEQQLPKSDLIICRDCLFHLPNQFVIAALNNFKLSGSTYLLATEQRWVTQNKELTKEELNNESGNKPINLEIAPFNLGQSLEFHDEKLWRRSLSLWKLN